MKSTRTERVLLSFAAADIIKFSLQICINISNILGAVVYMLFLENNEARDLHCCARLKRDYMPFLSIEFNPILPASGLVSSASVDGIRML